MIKRYNSNLNASGIVTAPSGIFEVLEVSQSLTVSGIPVTAGTSGGGGSPLTVQEVDGSPSVSNVSIIRFSNGTVTNDGGGQVTITNTGGGGGGSLTVQEQDGIPTITGVNTIKVSNNTLTDEGGGVVSLNFATGGSGFGNGLTTSGYYFNPEAKPEVVHPRSDWFDDNSTNPTRSGSHFIDWTKWTLWDVDTVSGTSHGRTLAAVQADGTSTDTNIMLVSHDATTAGGWVGFYQARPDASFSITAKVGLTAFSTEAADLRVGIFVAEDLTSSGSTADFIACSLYSTNTTAGATGFSQFESSRWTDYNSVSTTATTPTNAFPGTTAWVKIRYTHTNNQLETCISTDGIYWRELERFNPMPFPINKIGFGMQSASSSPHSQAVYFFAVGDASNRVFPVGHGRLLPVIVSGTGGIPSDLSVNSITAVTGTFTTGVTIGGGTTHLFPDSIRTGSIVASGVINAQAGITVSGVPVQTQVAISGTRVSYFNPDAPPVSGTSVDDEFDQNPTGRVGSGGITIDSKWTLFDPDGLISTSTTTHGVFADGFHLGTTAASADNTIIGYYQTIPAYTSWQFVVKVGALSMLGTATGNTYDDVVRIGLFIADNNIVSSPTTADLATVSLKIFSSNQFGFAYEEWTDYNSPTTTNIAQHIREVSVAANEQAIVQPGNVYLRIGWRASDNRIDTQYSLDGMTFVDLNAGLTTHPFTTGPTKIGIFKSIGTAENPTGRFYFFRMNNTAGFFRDDPAYGRRIRVS
jgi:hypothetical protein